MSAPHHEMHCREAQSLLPLFVDGELDARQMRGVALHSARCLPCERELREIERLQEIVATSIGESLATIDMSEVWRGVAPQLHGTPVGWLTRAREWWEDLDKRWVIRAPALGFATAALAFTVSTWPGESEQIAKPVTPDRQYAAATPRKPSDNTTIVSSMKSGMHRVAMMQEPRTNTLVLWVNDDGAGPSFQHVGGMR